MLTRTGLNFEVTLLSLDIGKFINLRHLMPNLMSIIIKAFMGCDGVSVPHLASFLLSLSLILP